MDVVAGILRLNGKTRITVEERPDLLIPTSIYRKLPIFEGDHLDFDLYIQNIAPLLYRHALDLAVKYLSVRARSRKEVETRLRLYGYPDETVNMVLFKLEKTGVLNDSDFAKQWTQAQSEKGSGKRNIARDLRQKGISRETAETALADVDETQQGENAKLLVKKWLPRYRNVNSKDAERKLIQALIRRGYDWEIAKSAVGLKDEDDN